MSNIVVVDKSQPVSFFSDDKVYGINTDMRPDDLDYPWTYADMSAGQFWLLHIPTPASDGWGLYGERLAQNNWQVVELRRQIYTEGLDT